MAPACSGAATAWNAAQLLRGGAPDRPGTAPRQVPGRPAQNQGWALIVLDEFVIAVCQMLSVAQKAAILP